jgi:PIN domain nuclease of toxin-antitoxin system
MRLLLDTNIVLALLPASSSALAPRLHAAIAEAGNELIVSVASLWEIAIKSRLGKLDAGMPPADVAGYLEAIGITVLPITRDHVVADLTSNPGTRDPFDRLLLAQCQVEGLRLVTLDRVLARHPLAWR